MEIVACTNEEHLPKGYEAVFNIEAYIHRQSSSPSRGPDVYRQGLSNFHYLSFVTFTTYIMAHL